MSRRRFSEQTNDGVRGSPGSPHLSYFWQPLQLSFVWNGLRSDATSARVASASQ